MKKLLFNTLSRQVKDLQKTARNTILRLLSELPNKTYKTDKIDIDRDIFTFDSERYAFVGCYIHEFENSGNYYRLKLLGYKIYNDGVNDNVLNDKLCEIELYNIDNIQLLNIITYINEIEFSEN